MDENTTIVLVVLIIAIVIVVAFLTMWFYTPYMGGYHHFGNGMMNGTHYY